MPILTKGVAELIEEISKSPKTINELEEIDIGWGTLNTRLKELKSAKLIRQALVERGGRTYKGYEITDLGMDAANLFKKIKKG